MNIKFLTVIIAVCLMASCIVASGIFFVFFQKKANVEVAEILSPDDSRALQTITQDGAAIIQAKLLGRHNWIDASRSIVGNAREVLARMGILNEALGNQSDNIVQGKVEKGDTIAGILEEAGADSVQKYVNAAAKVFSLRSFRAGQPYTVIKDPVTGQIRRFEYEVNDKHRLIVEGVDKPSARIEEIEYLVLLDNPGGIIEDNLFQSVTDIGENPQLAMRLVELFGSEINFIKDLQDGDKFSVLIEKRFRNGEEKGYGRILAARFVNKGKTYEAFLFRDGSGQLHHYNAKGENLKKTLLMAPLAVTRLTSRFTHNRKHPILGGERPHLGVDYGAPIGTPVKAVGHGTVIKRGWGGGYGNQIILKHGSSLESMYAHLSGFAKGIAPGKKVRQGQVIGFVGNTGLSTGPHLDFRLRQDGKFINPVKAINPRGAPVEAGRMSHFNRVKEQERAYLDGKELPENYTVNSIVPPMVESHKPVGHAERKTATKKLVRNKSRNTKKLASGKSAPARKAALKKGGQKTTASGRTAFKKRRTG